MNNSITVKELKNIIIQHFDYNIKLTEAGFLPSSIRILGPSGIGKTSAVEQSVAELSEKLGKEIRWKKINLANISDAADLVGFPKVKTLVKKDGEEKWVWDNSLKQYATWDITDKSVTSYAHPEWVEYLSEGGILLLDDFNRCQPRILQAIMDIIDRREYYSWKLPSDVLILLTGNPSGEDYIVATEDKAQTTRYITYNIDFDLYSWKEWAINKNIKYEFIDFIALNYEELFNDKASTTNIRQWTRLFALASIEELTPDFLISFGTACVGSANIPMLLEHLKEINKIEITAKDIFETKKYPEVEKTLRGLIFKKDYYRNSVAALVIGRMLNYIIEKCKSKTVKLDKEIDIILKLIANEIFSKETVNIIIDELHRLDNAALGIMMDNPEFLEIVSSIED